MPSSRTLDKESLATRYGEYYRWYVMVVIAFGTVGAVMLSTGFNVAIPALMQHFQIGNDAVQLAVTTFMVTSTIAMLPTPWLIQRFGLRHTFLGAVLLLAVSSLLGSLSITYTQLLAARSVQGICAGILYPLGTFVVMSMFPPTQQGRASGLMGFAIVLAPALAPALSGLIIDHHGWEAVFYMSLPFCLVALIGGWYVIPARTEDKSSDFDWTGMLLLSTMTLALLGVVTHLQDSPLGNGLLYFELALSLAALLWFLRHATRSPRALVSIEVFQRRSLLLGLVISTIYGFGIYGSTYLIPLYLQTVTGLSATHAGAILVPGGFALAFSLPLAGWLADHSSPRVTVISGLILLALSFAGMTAVALRQTADHFIELTVLCRIGAGLMIASLNQAAMQGMRGPMLAQAAMFIGYVRQFGGALGVAAVAVYIAWRSTRLGGDSMDAHAHAFAEAFLMSTVIFALAILVAWRMQGTSGTSKHSESGR